MVLIFAPVIIDVPKTRSNGIKFIAIRYSSFLFLKFTLILIFFKIIKKTKNTGIKIKVCLNKKIKGLTKWFIKLNSDKPDLFKP